MASTPRRSPMLAVVGVAMLIAPIAVLSAPAAASGDSRGAHTDVGAFVNPGETVTVEFPYRAEQYQWAVPDGVTTITVELAAGSGGSVSYGDGDDAVGGVGGYLIAQVPVADVPVVSIIVGARGAANAGGGSTAVAQSTAVLAVAGGGGAGWGCALPGLACARGGAGGFSAESGSSAGRDGENTSPLIDLSVAGTGGTLASAGLSRPEVAVESDGVSEPVSIIRAAAIQPDPGPMTVTAGVISPAVGPSAPPSRGAVPGTSPAGMEPHSRFPNSATAISHRVSTTRAAEAVAPASSPPASTRSRCGTTSATASPGSRTPCPSRMSSTPLSLN